jgi:hypothetical protein
VLVGRLIDLHPLSDPEGHQPCIERSCRVGIGMGVNVLNDVRTEPPGLIPHLTEGPTRRRCRRLRISVALHDLSPEYGCGTRHSF